MATYRDHPLYNKWKGIKQRCKGTKSKTDVKNYVDRGITVCSEWENNPEAFIQWALDNGWEQGLQIDRIDNDGDYEPNNCRFVSARVNCLNRRILRDDNTPGFKGISWHKSRHKWQASICIKGEQYYLGKFDKLEDAVNARNSFIIENNLEDEYKIQIIGVD